MNITQDFIFIPIDNGLFHYKIKLNAIPGREEYHSGIAKTYQFKIQLGYIELTIDKIFISFPCNPKDAENIQEHIFNQLTKK